MPQFNALRAVIARNLRLAVRRVDLLVQSVAVPLVVLGLASIIFGGSDAWPTAVIDESNTRESREVVEALAQTAGVTGPYYASVTTDAREAEELLAAGRLHLVVTIPRDFPATNTIEVGTYNINSDAMKNVRLRLATTANIADRLAGIRGVSADLVKERPGDVSRTAFMGGSAIILALMLGACLIAANLYAVETEYRTRREIALTPVGSSLAGAGAAVAGWLLSFATAIPTVLLAIAFGLRADWLDVTRAALIVLPAGLACAGLGVITAIVLKTHRLIQPTLILLALGSYFASGGFISVSALPPLARVVGTWWPVAYIFEWTNPVLHGFSGTPPPFAIAAVLAAAVLAIAASMYATRRDYRGAHTQGQ